MVLALDSGVLDHAPGVGLQARHGAANVAVNFDNLFDGAGFEEGRGNALFYAEDYAFACGYLYMVCENVFAEIVRWRSIRLSLLIQA